MNEQFDLVIIGSGPGGYIAAIRAAQLGMKTAIIEKEHLGGVCLNWGCIPTKALLKAAEVYHLVKSCETFGIKCDNISFDFKEVIQRSRKVAEKLSQGVNSLLKKHKITILDGQGKLLSNNKIAIDKEGKQTQITAKHIIIATGAKAKELPNLKIDGKFILSYKEAMMPEQLPKSLLIVGSGAIGVEFANFYHAFGTEVTIAEIAPRILIQEDEEIAALAYKSFTKRGIKILTDTSVLSAAIANNKVNVVLSNKLEQKFDKVLLAVGVTANTNNIGLENTKVKLENNGSIKTNEYCQTDEPNIYAIGDVASAPWLAHKASHEGVMCVEKIAGKVVHPMKKDNIPGCTYTTPQIASVGLTEAKAKEKGLDIKVGRFPFIANGKALAIGESEGMVKTIFDAKTGELLGAHMIGAEVTEMIQGFVIGKTLEATEAEFMYTVFPHPTISEAMHESVLDAFGKALNF